MKRKGKGRGKTPVVTLIMAAPILSIALSLLCAKLILSGVLKEEQLPMLSSAVAALVSFLLSLYASVRTAQKKLLWGVFTAIGYCCMLMLGNLLFFGVRYSGLVGILIPALVAGILAAMLGARKARKFA